MSIDFILPDIGEGIVECELLEWLVKEGEHIEEDQPVAEVMTDKATVQIPSMHTGRVNTLYYKPGDIAKVHAPLFSMDVTSKELPVSADTNTDEIDPNEASAAISVTSSATKTEDFILPDIGEGIVECEIVTWHVKEGDRVEEDQAVVEVMTDKAVVEIPAKSTGRVVKLYYQQGEIAKVHSPLFALQTEGSESSNEEPSSVTQQTSASIQSRSMVVSSWQDGAYEPPVAVPGKILASPAVRRLAREQAIDLTKITGTGKKGRILKADVQTPLPTESLPTTATATPPTFVASSSPVTLGGVRVEKMRGVRAAMAKQMTLSVQTIPHFTVSDELVMDPLMALRELLKPEFADKGIKLSFMPFFIKALSLALAEFPIINAQLNDDATELSFYEDHNIGFAVDSPIGLLVPNIKRVQALSIFDIAEQMQFIVDKAREGKLPSESLKGGTISISNVGTLGGITATPIINKPEAAIVALGKTQRLPRFDKDGNITAQHIMQVSWSGDHRIIDGATMVKFNNLWCRYLTEPMRMLTQMR